MACSFRFDIKVDDLGPKRQCLLKVKEEFSQVLFLKDANNNVSNLLKSN